MSRSSMFFVSDVRVAAESAAFALEEHGLSEEQVDTLAEELEEAITSYFDRVRDAVSQAAVLEQSHD